MDNEVERTLEAVIDRLWETLHTAKPTDNYRFLRSLILALEDELEDLRKETHGR